MSDKRRNEGVRSKTPKGGRLTIGLVADDIAMVGGQNALRGVADVARERDINLLCFHQRVFRDDGQTSVEVGPASWDSLAEVVDGLVIYQSWPSEEAFAGFCNRFPSLPMVNALRLYEGCPALAPDSYRGTKELTCHLIEVHGYRRIAFVAGPEGNWAVERRYRGYADALAEHGVPLDPNLVTPHLGWDDGNEAVRLLLDERGLLPGSDFEAVVTSNDTIALGVLNEFQGRGVRMPDDVAVVGFDDDRRSACSIPPLTTTRLPAYEIGRRAAEVVLAQITGQPVPERTLVPTRMMIRRSCGCRSPLVVQAAAKPQLSASSAEAGQKPVAILTAQREEILAEMVQAVGELGHGLDPAGAGQLLDGLAAELQGDAEGAFLTALDEVLHQEVMTGGDVPIWHGALSALRCHLLPHLDGESLSQAEDLWQQARVAIEVAVERVQVRQQRRMEQLTDTLRAVGASLSTTFDLEELMDVLAEGLSQLDIPSFYLSLYEDRQKPAEWSRLVLAQGDGGRIALDAGGMRFPSRRLVPQGMWPQRQYSYVIAPLRSQEEHIGFVLFELEPSKGPFYDVLRGEIGSALWGSLLIQARQEAEAALEKAYAEVERQVAERTAELEHETKERERAQQESARLQQEVIEAQRQALQELSTPIIPVMELPQGGGVIVMPLIGSIDTLRARDITRRLLAGIREHGARVVILDITGVPIVDSGVAAYLSKTIQAAQLKGARTIVTGISDAVAETIVDLGLDWSQIETLADLQTGLRAALGE